MIKLLKKIIQIKIALLGYNIKRRIKIMSKQVYISADYDYYNGDQEVVEELISWGSDNKHKVDFIDMSKVTSGSVSNDPDCRICDLKKEFNSQINSSSAVIFVVGDMTKNRTAGSACVRYQKPQWECTCTPYKQNVNGKKTCKVSSTSSPGKDDDIGSINSFSYLKHEFKQAEKKNKNIIIVYNSTRKESAWLPSYMDGYEDIAVPFWKYDVWGNKVGDYSYIKGVLGFD